MKKIENEELTFYELTIQLVEESESRRGCRFGPECFDGSWTRNSPRRPSNSEFILRSFQRMCSLAGLVR